MMKQDLSILSCDFVTLLMLNTWLEKVDVIADGYCSPYSAFFNGLFILSLTQGAGQSKNYGEKNENQMRGLWM